MTQTQSQLVGTVAVVLGRVPELSCREVEATLARTGRLISSLNVTSGVALVKASPAPDEAWFHTLGGATKFGVVLATVAPQIEDVVAVVTEQLGAQSRIGIGTHGLPRGLARSIGTVLKAAGLTRRFVTGEAGGELSSAQSKQFRFGKDAELLVVPCADEWLVIHITAAQRIDQFTLRDRGAPHQHARRGMLPTKLARTMVNIGLGLVPAEEKPWLLDPFCGTGRVLMEAVLLGAVPYGSDIDPVAVEATIGNLTWLDERHRFAKRGWKSAVAVASIGRSTHPNGVSVVDLYPPGSIDVIVTEPDLGPPQVGIIPPAQAGQILRTLVPTYEALLVAGRHLLKPQGGMVVVLPVIGRQALYAQIVDIIHRVGYHLEDSIRVSRPDQFVSRDIVILRNKK